MNNFVHNKNIRILLTSIGRRVELVQSFQNAAQRIGCALEITGADMSDTAPALVYCHQRLMVPRISDSEYIPALLRYCQSKGIHALIPTIDTDLLLLSRHRERFLAIGTQVCIAAPDKIMICRDKRFTADYFHSLGLASPMPVDNIRKYNSGFPAFIKPFDGSSSIGANRADTPEELTQYAAQLKSGYIIQPFITGKEYTVDIFCDLQGSPIYITPRLRLAVRSGEVLKTQIDHQAQIISEMQRLVADFKPKGGITVQLIRDENTGINHYIEINPRFGGGAPLSMKAGADAAEALLRCLMGEKLDYQPYAAANGAVYSRFDQSVCLSHGENETVKAVVFDLDDTLYSEKDYVRSGFKAVASLLPEIPRAEEKLWAAFEAKKPAIDTVLSENGLEMRKAECLRVYRNHKPNLKLYDGVTDLLTALHNQGIKIGVLTDGRPEGQRNKLEALGLYDRVDTVLITDNLGGPQFRKPNDISFRVMQGRLEVPYEQILYVGDNEHKDFQAPKLLGMQYIHIYNDDGLYRTQKQEGQVSSIAELTEVLSKKCK